MEKLIINSEPVIDQFMRFYKEPTQRWYVDLPDYPGLKADLQMVAGADTMLNILTEGGNECTLVVSEREFAEAEILRLVTGYHQQHGDYILENYRGEVINHKMWLCPVITYVFGRLPEEIFFKVVR